MAEKLIPSFLVKQTVKKNSYTSVFLAVPFFTILNLYSKYLLNDTCNSRFYFPITGKHLPHIVNRSSRITKIHHAASS